MSARQLPRRARRVDLRVFVAALAVATAALLVTAPRANAQGVGGYGGVDMTDGLMPGDYLRVSVGATSPIHPQGSLRDWSRGQSYALNWENWGASSGGVDMVAFGASIGYTLLPLDEAEFIRNFTPTLVTGQTASATASRAGVFELTTNARIRIPAPYIMPSVLIGFGFMNWHPGTIHYTTTTGDAADAKQQSRSGAELSIGGGLDKHIYDRFGIFAEALYTYGFTSFGQGLATPTGVCSNNGCDALKNTSIGTIRGGLRVRIGQ